MYVYCFIFNTIYNKRFKNTWVPRRLDNAPRTIDEIHREAEEEQIRQQQEIERLRQQDANRRGQPGQRGGRGAGGGGGVGGGGGGAAGGSGGGGGGGGGGGYQQQSNLRSASMDSDAFAANRPRPAAVASINLKSITSSNLTFGPPQFSKTAAASGAGKPPGVSTGGGKPGLKPQELNDADTRRGSMPIHSNNKPYKQQYSNVCYI